MSKDDIKVGDWIRLTGGAWKEEYPEVPEYVQIARHEQGFYFTEEADSVGDDDPEGANGLYTGEYACEKADPSEVPDEIRFKGHPSTHQPNKQEPAEIVTGILNELRDPINPDYYKFPSGVEVKDISRYLTSCGGQALQYIARSTRLDGKNKGDIVENLKKAIEVIGWEIERVENA